MSNAQNITVSDDDLPALFIAADKTSRQSQSGFVRCVAADLILIITASIAGAISYNTEGGKTFFAVLSALLMLSSLFLTLYIRGQKFEQSWYDGRAVAESVKTRAWRFMTCSSPYDLQNHDDAIKLFLENLKEVRDERKEFCASLASEEGSKPQFTDKMLSIRALSLDDRKRFYVSQRVEDQRDWYSRKSGYNKRLASTWSNAILATQFLGSIGALLLVVYPDLPFNAASVLAGIAAAMIAWLQMKRHRELTASYGLAAQELGTIAAQAQTTMTDAELSSFILDAENAISREHTMWRARRDSV